MLKYESNKIQQDLKKSKKFFIYFVKRFQHKNETFLTVILCYASRGYLFYLLFAGIMLSKSQMQYLYVFVSEHLR